MNDVIVFTGGVMLGATLATATLGVYFVPLMQTLRHKVGKLQLDLKYAQEQADMQVTHPPADVPGYRGQLFKHAVIEFDPANWTHHTQWHWSRRVAGKLLDYWPTRGKWQYDKGRVKHGDPAKFLWSRGEKL